MIAVEEYSLFYNLIVVLENLRVVAVVGDAMAVVDDSVIEEVVDLHGDDDDHTLERLKALALFGLVVLVLMVGLFR